MTTKREHTETLLVENAAFVLKLVTTQRISTQKRTQRGQLRTPDKDVEMSVSMDAGEHEVYEIEHTVQLTGSKGGTVILRLNPEALNLLVSSLSKAPRPGYGPISVIGAADFG